MSMMMAVATPVNCAGVPSHETAETVSIDDKYTIWKGYSCVTGHVFHVGFDSPVNTPVFWECKDHEIISYEI